MALLDGHDGKIRERLTARKRLKSAREESATQARESPCRRRPVTKPGGARRGSAAQPACPDSGADESLRLQRNSRTWKPSASERCARAGQARRSELK